MDGKGWVFVTAVAVSGAAAWWLVGGDDEPGGSRDAAVIRPRTAEADPPPQLPSAATGDAERIAEQTGAADEAVVVEPAEAVPEAVEPTPTPPGSATFRGRVVDAGGRPVPRADVSGWALPRHATSPVEPRPGPDRRTTADDAGRFELRLPVAGGRGPVTLEAEARGLAALLRVHGQAAADALYDELELTVDTARTLDGRVSTDRGAAVPDAEVVAGSAWTAGVVSATAHAGLFTGGPPGHAARTDATGRFSLTGLPGLPFQVTVHAEGFPTWSGRHAPGDPDLEVVLEQGLSLEGVVTGAHGGPAPGIQVAWARVGAVMGGAERERLEVLTDAAGRFTLHGLPPCDDGLLALRDGASPATHALHVEQPVVIVEPGPNRVALSLRPGRALAGRVLDDDGTPVPDARVGVVGDRLVDIGDAVMVPLPTWESGFPGAFTARTDAEGRFRIEGLYDGLFEVSTRHPEDPARTAAVEAASGREDLELVLDGKLAWGVTIRGHARDAVTLRPVKEFYVFPMLPAGNGGMISSDRSATFDDPAGAWRITGLKPGPMMLTAGADGYAPWSGELVEYALGEYVVDIDLSPVRSLALHVVDPRRRPLPEVSVGFRDRDGRELMVAHGPNSRTSMLRTDAQGEVHAHGLPAGSVTVTLKKGWLGARQEAVFDLRLPHHGVREVVYGEGDTTQLAIAVLRPAPGAAPLDPGLLGGGGDGSGTPSASTGPAAAAPSGLNASLQALTARLAEGTLAPPPTPSAVRVFDADGSLLAEIPLDRSDSRVQPPLNDGAPEGPWLLEVQVPRTPLRIEWHAADGGPTVRRDWQPPADLVAGDLLVLLLPPG